MASHTSSGPGHLDATTDRTVVFCHACHNEWFGDEHGQELCPGCGSDIIELVSVENDPRELYAEDHLTASSPDVPPRPYAEDSDPEEADIEEHMPYPGRFTMNQRMWDSRSPGHEENAHPFDRGFPRPGGDRGPPGEEGEAVFRRFVDMIGGFGTPGMDPGSSGPGSPRPDRDPFPPGLGGNVRRTTFTTPNGMHTTSVTITSGPIHFGMPRANRGGFPEAFRTILGGMVPPRPPQEGEEGEGGGGRGEGPPGGQGGPRDPATDLLSSLQELLSVMVDPANARHGDAVYSQEALDRIISNLMEQNPQSNAAPPASESAIANLERRKMDEAWKTKEGGKAECTVCIDEVKIDDEVIFLPCKHWFHEECVTMWLKEHNTCPICRTPIEASTGGGAGSRGPTGPSGRQGQGSSEASPQGGPPPPPPPFRGRAFGFPILFEARYPEAAGGSDHPARGFPGTSGDRENRWPNVGSRRSSMSPPNISDAGSRTRTRSPSSNSRRSTPAGEQEQQQQREGSRPFRWFQDRFGGRPDRRP